MKGLLTHTLAAVLGLIIGAVIGSSTSDDSGTKSTTPTPTETVTATETQTEPAPTVTATETQTEAEAAPTPTRGSANEIPGDGTFLVGEDIRPGMYRTSGPADSAIPNCYWARLSGTSGEFNEIIANGNTQGPTTVTISANDEAFQTTGCETWQKTG